MAKQAIERALDVRLVKVVAVPKLTVLDAIEDVLHLRIGRECAKAIANQRGSLLADRPPVDVCVQEEGCSIDEECSGRDDHQDHFKGRAESVMHARMIRRVLDACPRVPRDRDHLDRRIVITQMAAT